MALYLRGEVWWVRITVRDCGTVRESTGYRKAEKRAASTPGQSMDTRNRTGDVKNTMIFVGNWDYLDPARTRAYTEIS